MRHSDLRLTSAVYTDVAQLPTVGAIQALPSFSAGDELDGSKTCAQIGAQNSDKTSPGQAQPCAIEYMI